MGAAIVGPADSEKYELAPALSESLPMFQASEELQVIPRVSVRLRMRVKPPPAAKVRVREKNCCW